MTTAQFPANRDAQTEIRVEKFSMECGSGYRIFGTNLAGEEKNAIGFFGNRHSSRERLEKEFPELNLMAVRQTHSDILIQSPYSGEPPEADAHWTTQHNVSVGIRTADCVPVLIFDLENSFAVAIHAGWRGVENEIVVKSLRALGEQGFASQNAIALIGPHIALSSFEVGLDVAEKLAAAFQRSAPNKNLSPFEVTTVGTEKKTHVNLDRIVGAQLLSCGITEDRQTWLPIDTVTSPDHESFRRDRDQSGRQISFAALLKNR